MIEINGVAHVILTVSDWERCRPFYKALLNFMGLKRVFGGNDSIYYVGGRTAVGVGRCDAAHASHRFAQGGIGLHTSAFVVEAEKTWRRRTSFCWSKTLRLSTLQKTDRGRPGIIRYCLRILRESGSN